MAIIKASESQVDIVKGIAQETINSIYPKYYPVGAVNFFKSHHSNANIMTDIRNGNVYLLQVEDAFIGTVTKKENEICRLFVLPNYQHKGYGQELLDFVEEKIREDYSEILIDASLPAKNIYKTRGYSEIGYHQIVCDNGDVLCYDVMKKQ